MVITKEMYDELIAECKMSIADMKARKKKITWTWEKLS